jgi:hypothetical protein
MITTAVVSGLLGAGAHCFMWMFYSALVAVCAKALIMPKSGEIQFNTICRVVGWGHWPLLLWAAGVTVLWLVHPPSTLSEMRITTSAQVFVRAFAYVGGLFLSATYIARMFASPMRYAAAAVSIPAVVVTLALNLFKLSVGLVGSE